MFSVFVPVILACQAQVSDPAEDCRVYFGGIFNTEEACVSDVQLKGIPYLEEILPEGGSIEDVTCMEMEGREGSNL